MKVVWVLCLAFLVALLFSLSMSSLFLQNFGETLQSKLCNCDCEQVSQVPNDPRGDYDSIPPLNQHAPNDPSGYYESTPPSDYEIIKSFLIHFFKSDNKSDSVNRVNNKIENGQGVTSSPIPSTSAQSAHASVSSDKVATTCCFLLLALLHIGAFIFVFVYKTVSLYGFNVLRGEFPENSKFATISDTNCSLTPKILKERKSKGTKKLRKTKIVYNSLQ